MRLKYYLRGLGLGLVIAAVLMGVALGGEKEQLSDEEIRTRAAQLGMVDSAVLSSLKTENQEGNSSGKTEDSGGIEAPDENGDGEDTPEGTGDDADAPEGTGDDGVTGNPEGTGANVGKDKPVDTGNGDITDALKEPDTLEGMQISPQEKDSSITGAENTDSGERVQITIKRGDSSLTVSRALEEAGLVDDAREYDSYLCANGYDKYIKSGTFEIPAESTGEEIAKIITSKK